MGDQIAKPLVLVVEDDASLRRLVVMLLQRNGLATIDAGTAAEGLALVRDRNGAVDLAILDLIMPGMSGLDLAGDFGREYPDLKILYISGYADSVVADALARRSPDRLLLKPFTEQALLDRVHPLLVGCRTGEASV